MNLFLLQSRYLREIKEWFNLGQFDYIDYLKSDK